MTSQTDREVEQQESRRARRLQLLMYMLEDRMNEEDLQGVRIKSVTIRSGADRGGEVLVVVKGDYEGAPCVAFHSGPDAEAALRGACEKIKNNSLKYREDRLAGT